MELFVKGSYKEKYIALQPVKVQCDTERLPICIFSYDGTNRIRFTGQGSQPNLSRFTGTPKTNLLCDGFIIELFGNLSTHFSGKLSASQNVKM